MWQPRRKSNPIWLRAIDRYKEELAESADYRSIIEIESLDHLLKYAESIRPNLPREQMALASISRLGPMLKFVDDFSAILAVCFGADTALTACIWGSIRLMLSLASSAGDTLRNVLDMLEELSLTLPRFMAYEDMLPMDRSLENSLVDVYSEVICFYARCIYFFRTHPHLLLRRDAWGTFETDFSRTVRRIRRLSSTVESEAEAARMRHDRTKYGEVLEMMESLKDMRLRGGVESAARIFYVPAEMCATFCGRNEAIEAIEAALKPGAPGYALRSFALYGMGGVGKTQLALQYANRHRKDYSAILWVASDSTISAGNSLREIAKVVGVADNERDMQNDSNAILKVKNWLNFTGEFLAQLNLVHVSNN